MYNQQMTNTIILEFWYVEINTYKDYWRQILVSLLYIIIYIYKILQGRLVKFTVFLYMGIYVEVQHSTRCEDSCFGSLVQEASWSSLATFTQTWFVERGLDDQDYYCIAEISTWPS